jgi:MHS family proline/betaine transporter-like MFS transporter
MHRGPRDDGQPDGPSAGRSSPRRALVAAGIGNVVEWYDFALFGALATVLARTYFPGEDRDAGLLATFAVFATAFVFRPVGALVFGGRGDRRGRRQVLALMIVLMSLATAGVGMLPSYASIGPLAPVLLIVLRVVRACRPAARPAPPRRSSSSTRRQAGAAGTAGGSGRPWP